MTAPSLCVITNNSTQPFRSDASTPPIICLYKMAKIIKGTKIAIVKAINSSFFIRPYPDALKSLSATGFMLVPFT